MTSAARRHGLGHIAQVFRQALRRRNYARKPHPRPRLAAFQQQFGFFRTAETFAADFHAAVLPRLPLASITPTLLASLSDLTTILHDANRFAAGNTTLLGCQISAPDGRYDWHRDYGSGTRWPLDHFSRIRFMDGNGADVKYPWELSRMYWIAWLGNAYRASGDERWATEFQRLVDDWQQQNPRDVGVNWAMPMEVAIRGFWLTCGYSLFAGSPSISRDWWSSYVLLVWEHGDHLWHNLEYFFNLTNHYLSNCFGLLAIGAFLLDHPDGKRWFASGRKWMIEQLAAQLTSDGVHYERSIGYHRLVLEMYLIAIPLCQRAGVPFGESARRTVEQMAEFLCDYIPPSGTVPQFGDSDDGVILRLTESQALYDHRGLLALAAVIFHREDFTGQAGRFSLEGGMLMGDVGKMEYDRLGTKNREASHLYSHGGFAVLRNRWMHVVADVGPIGLHGNNDTLSFTIHTAAGQVVIDPGTFCYTRNPSLRNELRSTRAHNAPMIDRTEIAQFDGLWRVKQDSTNTTILEWEATDDGATLAAEHHAYRELPSGSVAVRRRWELRGPQLAVEDEIAGNGEHHVELRFTLPGMLPIEQIEPTRAIIGGGESGQIELECSHPFTITRGWYSPSYGVSEPAWWLVMSFDTSPPQRLRYLWRVLI
ncbi:MAG: alginate lyase family protein [Armatimonadetes bacterium]|nr:alginate lyase family protein [Armatimonadota bacterium]